MTFVLTREIIAQWVGLVALAFGVWSFLQRKDDRLKLYLAGTCLVMALHYFLLGAFAGMTVVLISGTRSLFSIYRRVPRWFAFIFVLLYLGLGLQAYEVWADALPVLGASIGAISLFYLKKLPMRLVLLCGTTCFLSYNLYVGSIGGAIMESFIWLANARTILKLWREIRAVSVPLTSGVSAP